MKKLILILASLGLFSSLYATDKKLCTHCNEIYKKAMEQMQQERKDFNVSYYDSKRKALIEHCNAVRIKERCNCKQERRSE